MRACEPLHTFFHVAFSYGISIRVSSARTQNTHESFDPYDTHAPCEKHNPPCAARSHPPPARPMGACVWAPSLQLTYALVGLWPGCVIPESARRGRPPRSPRPPRAPRAAGDGASVVVRDLVLFLLTLLLLLLVGPLLLVIVVVPVVHDLAVALAVVGCRDDLVLAYDDCARGRESAGQ